jgi:hypothetical protein
MRRRSFGLRASVAWCSDADGRRTPRRRQQRQPVGFITGTAPTKALSVVASISGSYRAQLGVISRSVIPGGWHCALGAVMTFFGFMHGEAIGLAVTPTVAIAYLIVATFIYGLGFSANDRDGDAGAEAHGARAAGDDTIAPPSRSGPRMNSGWRWSGPLSSHFCLPSDQAGCPEIGQAFSLAHAWRESRSVSMPRNWRRTRASPFHPARKGADLPRGEVTHPGMATVAPVGIPLAR